MSMEPVISDLTEVHVIRYIIGKNMNIKLSRSVRMKLVNYCSWQDRNYNFISPEAFDHRELLNFPTGCITLGY